MMLTASPHLEGSRISNDQDGVLNV